jgi:hypothetical protein
VSKKFHLYVDESGDHTYRYLDDLSHRYLGLTGIAIDSEYYRLEFQPQLEALKQSHFPHNPDEPIVLHRTELCNHRFAFGVLEDVERNTAWENDFAEFVRTSHYELFTVIIDKKTHRERYGDSAFHPYHYCLTCLLERFRGFLMFKRAKGDVIAEGRGKEPDLALKKVYQEIWEDGTRYISAQEFQKVLTSKELKIRYKKHNIAGLQLTDLLAHPSKISILSDRGKISQLTPSFGTHLAQLFRGKYNTYGKVLLE